MQRQRRQAEIIGQLAKGVVLLDRDKEEQSGAALQQHETRAFVAADTAGDRQA